MRATKSESGDIYVTLGPREDDSDQATYDRAMQCAIELWKNQWKDFPRVEKTKVTIRRHSRRGHYVVEETTIASIKESGFK